MAYNELTFDVRDKLAKGQFMDALVNPKLREAVFYTQGKTLDETIGHTAAVAETFHTSEEQRLNPGRSTKHNRGMMSEEPHQSYRKGWERIYHNQYKPDANATEGYIRCN